MKQQRMTTYAALGGLLLAPLWAGCGGPEVEAYSLAPISDPIPDGYELVKGDAPLQGDNVLDTSSQDGLELVTQGLLSSGETIGGSGGSPFSLTKDGSAFAGIAIRYGLYIDSIEVYHWNSDFTSRVRTGKAGGSGGDNTAWLLLDADEVVSSVSARADWVVNQLTICTSKNRCVQAGTATGSSMTATFQSGYFAGFTGRAGDFVDQLTVVRGEVTRARTPVEPPTVMRGRTPVTPPPPTVMRGRTPVTPPPPTVMRGRTPVADPHEARVEAETGDFFKNGDKAQWTKDGSVIEVKGAGAAASVAEGKGAIALYDVYLSKPGTYWVFLNSYAKDKNSNSLFLSVEGQKLGTVYHNKHGEWDWVRSGSSFTVSEAGTVSVRIERRELGFKIDKFIVTTLDKI